jgi:hypothetical protein
MKLVFCFKKFFKKEMQQEYVFTSQAMAEEVLKLGWLWMSLIIMIQFK